MPKRIEWIATWFDCHGVRYNAGCLAESYQEAINILDNQCIGFDAQKSVVTCDFTQPEICWHYKGRMHMNAHNKQDALLLYRGIYPNAALDDITQEQSSGAKL